FAAMLASGFWHGGASGMMVWGALHGIFLSAERLWAIRHPRTGFGARPAWVQVCQMLCVFVLGTLAMIPFRSSASVAIVYWTRLATAGAWELPDPRLVLLIVLCLGFDALQALGASETILLRAPRWIRVVALAALVGAVWLSPSGATPAF